jgi:hypothetical protein
MGLRGPGSLPTKALKSIVVAGSLGGFKGVAPQQKVEHFEMGGTLGGSPGISGYVPGRMNRGPTVGMGRGGLRQASGRVAGQGAQGSRVQRGQARQQSQARSRQEKNVQVKRGQDFQAQQSLRSQEVFTQPRPTSSPAQAKFDAVRSSSSAPKTTPAPTPAPTPTPAQQAARGGAPATRVPRSQQAAPVNNVQANINKRAAEAQAKVNQKVDAAEARLSQKGTTVPRPPRTTAAQDIAKNEQFAKNVGKGLGVAAGIAAPTVGALVVFGTDDSQPTLPPTSKKPATPAPKKSKAFDPSTSFVTQSGGARTSKAPVKINQSKLNALATPPSISPFGKGAYQSPAPPGVARKPQSGIGTFIMPDKNPGGSSVTGFPDSTFILGNTPNANAVASRAKAKIANYSGLKEEFKRADSLEDFARLGVGAPLRALSKGFSLLGRLTSQ